MNDSSIYEGGGNRKAEFKLENAFNFLAITKKFYQLNGKQKSWRLLI